MNQHLIYWVVILGLVLAIIYLRSCSQPEIITETVTETVTERDTVIVRDTLYVEVIPEPERETVEGEGETEVIRESERHLFRSSYSDPMIQITSNLRVNLVTGDVVDTRFQYIIKRRYVRDRELQLTINTTTTTSVTRTVFSGPFLTVGVIAGPNEITPLVGYTLRNRITLFAGYDIHNDSPRGGVMVPLRSLF